MAGTSPTPNWAQQAEEVLCRLIQRAGLPEALVPLPFISELISFRMAVSVKW